MSKIWAHRGASAYAPENTLEAFSLAIDMKAEGIELDAHLSKDGVLMVGHDESINRCSNGKGYVRDYTCAELKTFDFSYRFPQYKGAKMPTLAEVYELMKPAGLFINVEIKCLPFLYEGVEEKLDKLARDMGMEDRIIYSSFDHYTLVKMRQINPKVPLGILYDEAIYQPWKYAADMGVNALHPHFASLNRDITAPSQAAGIMVHPWTVDDPDIMREMYRQQVEAIITNKPDLARKVLEEMA